MIIDLKDLAEVREVKEEDYYRVGSVNNHYSNNISCSMSP